MHAAISRRTCAGAGSRHLSPDDAMPPLQPPVDDPCVSAFPTDGRDEEVQSASTVQTVDLQRIERAVREILAAIGEDPDRDGLRDTPARVARMYAELFGGLQLEPGRHLRKTFSENYDELVLVRDIAFHSMCEHHLLPFIGVAHVGYLPRGKVVGLSKLARVVEEVSRRPQVQERMTHQIADLLQQELDPKGVVVVLEAGHSCMTIRGIRKPGSLTITSAVRGLFKTNQSSRAEAMSLIYGPRPASI
jgi:GTP cyclohydrolase I